MKFSIRMIAAAPVLLVILAGLPETASAQQVRIELSPEEIRIIREHYAARHSAENPGEKAKPKRGAGPSRARGGGRNGGLPPGIAKNLERGKPLPPGIAKQHLPETLRRKLPRPPDGYERVIVDGKVLLVEIATEVIRDVLADAILD